MSRIITAPRLPLRETAAAAAPGLCLAILIALAAHSLEEIERALTGTAWIEALVIALVRGAGARSAGPGSARAHRGVGVAPRGRAERRVGEACGGEGRTPGCPECENDSDKKNTGRKRQETNGTE